MKKYQKGINFNFSKLFNLVLDRFLSIRREHMFDRSFIVLVLIYLFLAIVAVLIYLVIAACLIYLFIVIVTVLSYFFLGVFTRFTCFCTTKSG